MKCLRECARNGSPLVILAKDGELYFPISDQMPDTDQRQKLMPFLGKYARASGTVYERKGTLCSRASCREAATIWRQTGRDAVNGTAKDTLLFSP
jgi:hypothetical protein